MNDRDLGLDAFTQWYRASNYSQVMGLNDAIAAKDAKSPSFFKNLGGTVRSIGASKTNAAMRMLGVASGAKMPMTTEFFSALGGQIEGFKFEYVTQAVTETAKTVATAVGTGLSIYAIVLGVVGVILLLSYRKK